MNPRTAFALCLGIYVLGGSADAFTTWLGLSFPGIRETNPFVVAMIRTVGAPLAVSLDKVIVAAIAYGSSALLGWLLPERLSAQRLNRTFFATLGVIFLTFGISNYRLILAHRL